MKIKISVTATDAIKQEGKSFLESINLDKVGQGVVAQIRNDFNASQDPYGNKWQALKYPRRAPRNTDNKPLVDSGKLRDSYSYRKIKMGLTIATTVKYAQYHQFGTARMVARKMLPELEAPQTWVDAIQAAIDSTP